jgi:RecA/RadA recombinase
VSERRIALKRAVKIKDTTWPAREYRVPDEMSSSLADWLLSKMPSVAEETGEPLEVEGDASLADVLPEAPIPISKKIAFDKLSELVGNDLIEVFGDAGSGKSRLVGHIAIEAQEAGKRVLFLDNENSLPKPIAARLKNYRYVGIDLDKIIEQVANTKEQYDLICLDSIGFPVLIDYVRLSLREQLRAIQKMILLRGYLKDYAIRNKGISIATNQPVSEYSYASGKIEEGQPLEPFGGKGMFISKLLLRTDPIRKGETTRIAIKTYKARDLPFDKQIAEFVVTGEGTELRWL